MPYRFLLPPSEFLRFKAAIVDTSVALSADDGATRFSDDENLAAELRIRSYVIFLTWIISATSLKLPNSTLLHQPNVDSETLISVAVPGVFVAMFYFGHSLGTSTWNETSQLG
jgi:hypothetical protein